MPRSPKRTPEEPAHAEGKRHVALPDREAAPKARPTGPGGHHQPWVPTSGLVGRTRRSARRG